MASSVTGSLMDVFQAPECKSDTADSRLVITSQNKESMMFENELHS